jgi:hypothetical protein
MVAGRRALMGCLFGVFFVYLLFVAPLAAIAVAILYLAIVLSRE